jgi:hypothetical protein
MIKEALTCIFLPLPIWRSVGKKNINMKNVLIASEGWQGLGNGRLIPP